MKLFAFVIAVLFLAIAGGSPIQTLGLAAPVGLIIFVNWAANSLARLLKP